MQYYGIKVGRLIGVFYIWARVEELTLGFPGQKQRGFATFEEAYLFAYGEPWDGPDDFFEIFHPDGWVARVAASDALLDEVAAAAPVPGEPGPEGGPNRLKVTYEGRSRTVLMTDEVEGLLYEGGVLPLS